MRMEDHFRDTLHRAVANEPPVVDAWDRFERRARRGRSMRLGFSLAAGLAVIAAVVFVVPRLVTDRSGFIEPGPGPTHAPTVDPYARWEPFGRDQEHYRLRYPTGWQLRPSEGNWEIQPPGMQGLAAGGKGSFGVEIAVLDRSIAGELANATRGIRADGREYLRSEAVVAGEGGPGVRQVIYRIDWSASRCGIDPGECPAGDAFILNALIVGEDIDSFFGQYQEQGELIVNSIERVD